MARLFSIFCFRHISSSQRVWLCEKWIKSPVVWWSRQIIGRRSNFPILKTFLKHSFTSFEPGTVFHFNQQSAREQWHKNYSLSLATTLENLSHFMWEFTEVLQISRRNYFTVGYWSLIGQRLISWRQNGTVRHNLRCELVVCKEQCVYVPMFHNVVV